MACLEDLAYKLNWHNTRRKYSSSLQEEEAFQIRLLQVDDSRMIIGTSTDSPVMREARKIS